MLLLHGLNAAWLVLKKASFEIFNLQKQRHIHIPEAILHLIDDLHHLRDHLLSHICLKNHFLFPLALHLSLQDINGLQQSLDKAESAVRNMGQVLKC